MDLHGRGCLHAEHAARRVTFPPIGCRQERLGRSFINPRALEELVRTQIPFRRLHDNVDTGVVQALVVAALNIANTKTTMFAEVAPAARFVPSRDPRRQGSLTQIECGHVLASAAILLVFPARRIGSEYYCDGGVLMR